MTDQPDLPDESPATKLIYQTLYHHGPMSQNDLAEYTGLAKRTVRKSTNTLVDGTDVNESDHPKDGRQDIYWVKGRRRKRLR